MGDYGDTYDEGGDDEDGGDVGEMDDGTGEYCPSTSDPEYADKYCAKCKMWRINDPQFFFSYCPKCGEAAGMETVAYGECVPSGPAPKRSYKRAYYLREKLDNANGPCPFIGVEVVGSVVDEIRRLGLLPDCRDPVIARHVIKSVLRHLSTDASITPEKRKRLQLPANKERWGTIWCKICGGFVQFPGAFRHEVIMGYYRGIQDAFLESRERLWEGSARRRKNIPFLEYIIARLIVNVYGEAEYAKVAAWFQPPRTKGAAQKCRAFFEEWAKTVARWETVKDLPDAVVSYLEAVRAVPVYQKLPPSLPWPFNPSSVALDFRCHCALLRGLSTPHDTWCVSGSEMGESGIPQYMWRAHKFRCVPVERGRKADKGVSETD